MPLEIKVLSQEVIERILAEAFQLLEKPGVKVQSGEARQLLGEAGAGVDNWSEVVHIPEKLARQALQSVPTDFILYDQNGCPRINYYGKSRINNSRPVHFDPGSCGVYILDSKSMEHKLALSGDLVQLIKITEMLPAYDAQSTAVTCNDVPEEISDLYRLYLVLLFSSKPIVTGAFSIRTGIMMYELLQIIAGSSEDFSHKPFAIFDVCPNPPLTWSEFGSQSLINLARRGVPAQIVSMPLAGATAPVTLIGAIVQHAAECLSGITIHQLAHPGAPIVWGGAPAIFDMRYGTTPMGAMETALVDVGYAQVGQYLELPTHAYMGASDAKIVDAQAGMESILTMLIGALTGINMISGAGMLDFLACQSPEKLVIDAEAIAMIKRFLRGIDTHTETLATEMFAEFDFSGSFLKQKITRQLFSLEQYFPSSIIDRGSIRAWQDSGHSDTFIRAKHKVQELINNYQRPLKSHEQENALHEYIQFAARNAGMKHLPPLEDHLS